MKFHRLILAAVLIALSSTQVSAAWTTVGDGIEYQEFTTPDPNRLFVCRMLRSNTNATLETSVANGTVSGARETVLNQASRYDDTLSWWGQSWGARNDVICAINGDFFNGTTGVITGGQCHSGWYAKRFGDWGGYSGFGWTVNRVPIIGGCVYHRPQDQIMKHVATGVTQQFDGINVSRGSGQMIIYTPQYNSQTPAATTGVEVLVEVVRPMVIILSPNKVIGNVRAIWQNSGEHYIPFDHVVISADGSKATTLLSNVSIGSEIWISQFPTDYNEPDIHGQGGCATGTGLDWQKAFAAIGINYRFLEAGAVRPPDPAHSGYAGLVVRNPRTAIAYNSTHIFFVVCDGRSAQSVGMTMTELGNWCLNTLTAAEGVNLDGGGSSTMVVNGVVKNVPSDGSQRAVANGVMMVNVLPKQQTTTYSAGQSVRTNTAANVRLGPGTNYASIYTAPYGTQGTVQTHSLNGVLAKGNNWWKVSFPSATGWVAESLLQCVGAPPSAVTVTDEGTWTPSLTTLKASWTAATPGCAAIARYDYAIGTSPTSQNVRAWTSAGTATSVTASGLSLMDGGVYYIQVRAVDAGGQMGPASSADGITVAPGTNPIGAAWGTPNSTGLSIRNKVVTAALGGAFWIEEQDRSAAIKVVSSASVSRGNTVSAAGVLGMSGTQRALIGDVVINLGGAGPIPAPLGMVHGVLGGAGVNAWTPGVTGGASAYNIGILAKCWGNVTYSNSSNPSDRFFYIDDGSGISDGSGHPGVKVRCGSTAPPASGMVAVTGVVASEQAGLSIVPVLLVRDGADIRAL